MRKDFAAALATANRFKKENEQLKAEIKRLKSLVTISAELRPELCRYRHEQALSWIGDHDPRIVDLAEEKFELFRAPPPSPEEG